MEVDRKLLSQVRKIAEIGSDHVMVCMRTQNVIRRRNIEPAILILTERFFVLLTESTGPLAIQEKFPWCELTHVNLLSKLQLQINKATGGIVLQQQNANELASYIIWYLNSILLDGERPGFEGDKSFVTDFKQIKMPYYQRFLYFLEKNKLHIESDTLKEIKEQMKKQTKMDFSKIPKIEQFSNLLLEALKINSKLTSLVLPRCRNGTIWNNLASLIKKQTNPNLVSLSVYDQVDESFTALIEAVKSSNFKIDRFTFNNTNLRSEHVQMILDFLQDSEVKFLELSNAYKGTFLNKFLPKAGNTLKKLKTLKLSNIENLNVQELFKNIPSIRDLRISHCNVDVSSTLCSLASTTLNSFTISHSKALTSINKNYQLPVSLDKINCHNIQWETTSFADAWVLFLRHKPVSNSINLNMSSAIVPDNVWQAFFNGIPNLVNSRLTHLTYDNNPIRQQFFDFIKGLTNLKYLSVVGCFKSENPTLVSQFGQIIADNTSIKTLNISGDQFGKMKEATIPFLRLLKLNTTLESINLSSNDFGDLGLRTLQETLIENTKLNKVLFDDNNIKQPESYVRFIETMGGRGAPLYFNWPEEEFQKMLKRKLIKHEYVDTLHKIYEKVKNMKVIDDENDELIEQEIIMYSTGRRAGNINELEIGEWCLPFGELPNPDNKEILQQESAKFTTENLVQRFYQTL